MTATIERTVGEWQVSKHATPDYAPQYGVYADGQSHDHCTVKGDNAKADAEYICRAVNSHAALVEALTECLEDYRDMMFVATSQDEIEEVDAMLRTIKAALAKATA